MLRLDVRLGEIWVFSPLILFLLGGIHVCCSYIELLRSKLLKTGDLQVVNRHVNCQHSSLLCMPVICVGECRLTAKYDFYAN